jgi:hypothetical protein
VPHDLIDLIGAAHQRGGVVTSLSDLIGRLNLEGATLDAIAVIQDQTHRAGLELVPAIGEGDLETERFLRPIVSAAEVQVLLERELAAGEGSLLEFKGSLMFDRQRAAFDKTAQDKDLNSEAVLESALKTICAFLNTAGGVLLIGVKNDGTILGIEDDHRFTGVAPGAAMNEKNDAWELHTRNLVTGRFHEGRGMNSLVSIAIVPVGNACVARIAVGKRKKLAAVKCGGKFEVFVRHGNRTDRLECHEIEDVVRDRVERERRDA